MREAKERVRAAIAASRYTFPSRSIIVNLSPADLPKAGSAYDLPIALGVLVASGQVDDPVTRVVALGELALDGRVRPVVGSLGAALVASELGLPCVLASQSSGASAVADRVSIIPADHLTEAVAGALGAPTGRALAVPDIADVTGHDISDVRGQPEARRALELAAAGGHHLLMTGAPGAGKTMLARCLPGLLPPLESDEVLEVALAWGAAGRDAVHSDLAPFRAPHHSATLAALIGGGSGVPVPGEVTLAHRGVLFLDELGEFPVSLLDALRQPVEDGRVVVARKGASVSFPCEFQLVAATNPCPCGYEGDWLVACRCTERGRERYRRRFSGPLIDRFDLRVKVPRLGPDELGGPPAESSDAVRRRVVAARKRQLARGSLNRGLTRPALDALAWTQEARLLLARSVRREALTARGWDRVRRVAVTVADLEESGVIGEQHVAEALSFRGEL